MSEVEQIDEAELVDYENEPGVEDILDGEFPEPEPEGEQAIAEAEGEGSPAEPEGSTEDQDARDISIATEKAMQELFAIQDKLDAAIRDHATKAEVANNAKAWVKVLQENLSSATKQLRDARTKSEPDPGRYPLLDGRKAEINATFAKPDAIQPLPAEDFAEHYRRESEKCGLDSIGLKPATLKVLADLGLRTVADYGRKSMAVSEGGADMTSVKSLTEKRVNEIADAIEAVSQRWSEEWRAMHPETEAPAEEGGWDA